MSTDQPATTTSPTSPTTPAAPSPTPLTSVVRHELRMRRLTVLRLERPTARLVRVTLGGPDMEGFRSDGAGDHVKVFFPEPGATDAVLPEVGPGGLVPTPGAGRPRGRDYTPRHERLADGELVLDIVLHDRGVGSDWARRAAIGDTLGVGGPRGSRVLVEPIDGLVLFGDETALPAIANFLAATRPDQHVRAHVEVADDADMQPIESPHPVVWHPRNGVSPGRSDLLIEAARSVDLAAGRILHWVAAETAVAAAVRQQLVERGTDSNAIEAKGYWKLATEDHQEPHSD